MNQLKRTTMRLTIIYSLVFFCFLWTFSAGLYLWTNNSFGKGYINRINDVIEQSNIRNHSTGEFSDDAATVAADVALDRLRNILVIINGIALLAVPTFAYQLSRRSLQPLVRSQAQQQQFIANASHELRTPLAVMSGELELAARQPRSMKEYRQTIDNTRGEVERMTTLVQELLLLARISNDGAAKLKTATIEIDDLIQETKQLYAVKAKEKQITIKQSGLTHKTVIGKRDLMAIALGNLIDNAVKFSDRGTTIIIAITKDKNNLAIAVKNTGQPIRQDVIKHLFERFYQSETTHSEIGSGLGLAIAKQIAVLHGWFIRVSSEGILTTFTIEIPQ